MLPNDGLVGHIISMHTAHAALPEAAVAGRYTFGWVPCIVVHTLLHDYVVDSRLRHHHPASILAWLFHTELKPMYRNINHA